MNPRLKKILNFVFIFGTLGVVLLIGVNGEEMSGAVDALKSVAPLWIALCAVAYGGYVLMDALSVHYYLRKQGYPITVGYALYVAICGLYYSNITPGATGGQPMQVYYLTKRNVPIGIGTLALTVKFFSFQFMLAVYSTVLWIAYGSYVAACVGSNMWILIVGYVYNMFSVSLVVLMAINKRLVWAIIKLLVRIGAKFRLCKHPEATLTKWEDVLDTFHSSVMSLREHPGELMVQLLIGGAQLIALMTVTFFIYKGFELAGGKLRSDHHDGDALICECGLHAPARSVRCAGGSFCPLLCEHLPLRHSFHGAASLAFLHLLHFPHHRSHRHHRQGFPPRQAKIRAGRGEVREKRSMRGRGPF